MAFHIIRHAVRMIFGNFGQAMRIVFVPMAIAIFIATVMPIILDRLLVRSAIVLTLLYFLLILFAIVLTGWVAVSWHRYVLLEEYAGKMPRFSRREVAPYLWKSFFLICILFVCMFPLALVGSMLGPIFGSRAAGLIDISLLFVGPYLWFRFGLELPATALGKPIGFRASWGETRKLNATIWGASAMFVCLCIILQIGPLMFLSPSPYVQLVQLFGAVLLNVLLMLVSLSILTTLYGHLIEKRSLVD